MGSWKFGMVMATAVACNGATDDKTGSTPTTTPTGDSGDSSQSSPTGSTGVTGDTAPTDTALEPPSWSETLLQQMNYAKEFSGMGAVFAVDDEVWLMWEVTERDQDGALILERHIAGEAPERINVSTLLSHPNESVTAALRGHADWTEIIVQKRVDCDPAIHGTCAQVASEAELVFIDRTTMATRIEPIVVPALQAIEKGRGSFDLNADGLFACFKANYPGPVRDEVHCIERDRQGNTNAFDITQQSLGGDDHPSVALRSLDDRRYIAFTSTRDGPRATMLATDDSMIHMHDPAIRSEDPMITQTASGELVLTWAEHRGSDGALVAATCTGADCRDLSAWTLTDVDTGSNKVVAPAITMHEGRPVIAYGIGDEVRLAIRCDEGWRVERPWDHGQAQWTQRGQSSVSGSTHGIIHLIITEADAAGVQQTWWGQRTGAPCPAL